MRARNSAGLKGKPTWNKGKKLTLLHKKRISKSLLGHKFGRGETPEVEEQRKIKISASMKANPNAGGYRYGSGRGKKGRYKGFWCDSTYELVFVIFNLDHNTPFERNWEKFEYEYQGVKRAWIPDFKMKDGSFVEIKGYETEQFKAKCKNFTKPLKILRRVDMDEMFNYVEKKYGKDLVNLYD